MHPPDIDSARAEQLFQPVLGENRQAALSLAFRMPNLRRIDALEPDALFVRTDGSPSITINAAPMAARVVIKGLARITLMRLLSGRCVVR